jgi:hypothetical protein
MELLHAHGEQHGDIRNDHIIVEADTGIYRWIDFDYQVNFADYDIFGMGNVLNYAVGKGIQTCRGYAGRGPRSAEDAADVYNEDALLFYRYRLANLRKIFPYIPPELNEMLMRFSAEATFFYESLTEMAEDLRRILDEVWPGSGQEPPGAGRS